MTRGRKDPREVGRLCLGADWACAHGDVETLGYIAGQLAACAPDALHREFVELAHLCSVEPERASEVWPQLRHRVLQSEPAVA